MTDNEIIKALECLSGINILCKECAYHKKFHYPDCRQEAAENALDLINRQKAEIDQYAQDQHELMIEMDKLFDTVEKQKAEIEKLDTLEYYKKILDYYALQFGTVKDKQKVIDEAKAEAVKELLIRLTMHFATYRAEDEIKIKDMFQIIQKFAEETVGDADA